VTGVQLIEVSGDDDDIRLDRWFRRHYPDLGHGRLEKLIRKGQVRIDGARAKASTRLVAGQQVRVPPFGELGKRPKKKPARLSLSKQEEADLRARVIYRDDDVLAINKPAGLAVQGGSGTTKHLDAMLDALTFEAKERPRLVHRLDKDTSGVLLLGRNASAAAKLAEAFRRKTTRKVYWAMVAGVPRPHEGKIDAKLAKLPGKGGERVQVDAKAGKPATTYYAVVEAAAQRCAWVGLMPVTGRTHQLRVHMAAIGHPIVGDGKYGDVELDLPGLPDGLHLHAREITIAGPNKRIVQAVAPLPDHMAETWKLFGFNANNDGDPFAELEI